MSKKLLSHSVKILKLGTWIGGILATLVVLVVTAVMIFPVLIQGPIEAQLSELSDLDVKISKPYFDFKDDNLFLKIDKLEAFNIESAPNGNPLGGQKSLVVTVDKLKWDIYLYSLFTDIYNSDEIFIDVLTLDLNAIQSNIEFGASQVQTLAALPNSEIFEFLKALDIKKMFVKGEQNIEIAPILITANNKQLTLKITGQSLNLEALESNTSKVDIIATISSAQSADELLNLPISISNEELLITTNVKFTNQAGGNVVELESFLEQMPANKLVNYLPLQFVGDDVYTWIKQGLLAGTLQDSKLKIKQNLSKSSDAQVQFSTQLKALELKFDADWEPLKKLNASFELDGKRMTVMVHDGKLNDMALNAIKVQIDDINQQDLEVKVTGNINTQSERLVEFLKRTPLNKSVHKVLNSINLSGKVDGDMRLVLPLDERESILDIDLNLKDNRLSALNDKVVIEGYNSKLAFHHHKITTTGRGKIHGRSFDIRINPNDKADDHKRIFGVELINSGGGFKTYITQQPDQSWRGKIESESVKGKVAVFPNEEGIPDVRLLELQVTSLGAIKGDWKITPEDFPSMHLDAKNIRINENTFPDFSAKLVSKEGVLSINNLELKGVGVSKKVLSFQGAWDGKNTRLSAKAKGKNLAEFLQRLKVKEKVTGGEFDFDVSLACECAPWNMNYQDITGYFDVNVKEGVFTDQDPNIGRILSLLNIKSIAKRLSLNFSDVTNKGFTYEHIKTQVRLKNAVAKIENFNLKALSGNIVLTGQSHIIDKQYDLVAKVTPAISNAVPIATYLAGGGLIGLGVWAIDKTLFDGNLINKAAVFKYKITGAWDKPIIKEQ
jgi:uncharacterized protein YhdP